MGKAKPGLNASVYTGLNEYRFKNIKIFKYFKYYKSQIIYAKYIQNSQKSSKFEQDLNKMKYYYFKKSPRD